MPRTGRDVAGERFGRWTVIAKSEERAAKYHVSFLCRCDCGTERVVSGSYLRAGNSSSCGCLAREVNRESHTRHGLRKHRLHGTWRSMKQRCLNPKAANYHLYGGRGIKVCERWLSVANFIADNDALALPGLQIDRIDNDGHYEPLNVRWVSAQTQARNRRSNRLLTHSGKEQSVTEWADELDIPVGSLLKRLRSGWSVDRCLTTPINQSPGL